MDLQNPEKLAAVLEATGDYRVLRRLKPRAVIHQPDDEPTRVAIFLDLETTGLDPTKDEIIEIAMVPFTYGINNGRLYEVREPFQQLRQPASPITADINALTGITNEMVAGKTIDPADISRFIGTSSLIVAHNAGFDRPFAERFWSGFTDAAWACSMTQIPWKDEGSSGVGLEYLAMNSGFFFDAHRATDDCLAAIELLARPLPKAGTSAMTALLAAARKTTCRIWAENSPFDLKDHLKARGYRWNDGSDARPRAWYVDVPEENVVNELTFLKAEIYQRDVEPIVTRITARDRFSGRI
jgi:DNA polymerase-3 subunit epsilon